MPADFLHAGLLNLVNIAQYFSQFKLFSPSKTMCKIGLAFFTFFVQSKSYMFYHQNVTPHYIPEKQISW